MCATAAACSAAYAAALAAGVGALRAEAPASPPRCRIASATPRSPEAKKRARVCEDLGTGTVDLDDYVYTALRAGASGYLLKDTPAPELLTALRVIADGNALLAPTIAKRLIEEFANRPDPPADPTQLEDLTEREHEVLQLLATGLSNREIAATLYIGEATAKTHVSRVLTKLGVRNRVRAVILAYDYGVVHPKLA